VSDAPQQTNSATGVYKPLLQIDIYSSDPKVTGQIVERLDQLLETPRNRASRIESENYKCDLMVRQDGSPTFTNVRQDDKKINQHATQWRATVVVK